MSYVVGIDGGGTRTTVVVADASGTELLRYVGPAGIVDPRAPAESVASLVSLVRQGTTRSGKSEPATALCAGLAGVGGAAECEAVRAALVASGLARRVEVVTDGEIALEGAFRGGAGILMIAGTGSVAHGRGPDGRVGRCGGWGRIIGDEGSGYWIGRMALSAALRSVDGRGPESRLLPVLLEQVGLGSHLELPAWAGRAAKSEIATLAPHVLHLAETGDGPALQVARDAAHEQVLLATALIRRLGPWRREPPIALSGGVYRNTLFVELVRQELDAQLAGGFRVEAPAADAVTGAVRMAARAGGA